MSNKKGIIFDGQFASSKIFNLSKYTVHGNAFRSDMSNNSISICFGSIPSLVWHSM